MVINLPEETIEKRAAYIREKVGMEHIYALDMDSVLLRLMKKSSLFRIQRSNIGELEDDEAFMNCESHVMLLSSVVFDNLKANEKRAKFTAAHELGHYVLGHSGNTRRSKDKGIYLTPRQRIQEDEANRFAAFLLVPTELALNCNSSKEIEDKFQVSTKVSEIAFQRVQDILRKRNGELRQPPAVVLDFLRKAEKEGYKIRTNIPRED